MDRKGVLDSAIDEAREAVRTLEGWIDTLERGRKAGMVLSRKDMLGCIRMMQLGGLEGFLDSKFYDEVFEAMTGERP